MSERSARRHSYTLVLVACNAQYRCCKCSVQVRRQRRSGFSEVMCQFLTKGNTHIGSHLLTVASSCFCCCLLLLLLFTVKTQSRQNTTWLSLVFLILVKYRSHHNTAFNAALTNELYFGVIILKRPHSHLVHTSL
jgi:hypothetical protein